MSTYRDPKVDPQLQSGSPTEGADCAVQTTRGAIRWATNGASVPTVKEIRAAIGEPSGGIDVLDVKQACTHWNVEARVTNSVDDVRNALIAGFAVVASINYHYLNKTYPQLSGDRGFTGTAAKPALHSVLLYGAEKVLQGQHGPLWVQDHDPLHDARRQSVPKEAVNARFRWLAECMQAMPSGVQAVIVKLGVTP